MKLSPTEVLPDRSASTLAKWLKQHPEIEVVTRDRWGDYARGVATGAPQAQQVLDRWHLVKNLREALERQLGRYREVIQTVKLSTGEHPALPLHSTAMERASVEALDRQRTRYQELFQAHQQGKSINHIVKEFGVHRATVQRAIRQKGTVTRRRHARPTGILTPFEPLLQEKWSTCQNASQLYRDLVSAGFTGTKRSVCRWAQERRVVPAPTTPGPYRESAIRNHASGEQTRAKVGIRVAEASWLIFSFAEELDDVQETLLQQLLQFPPLLAGPGYRS